MGLIESILKATGLEEPIAKALAATNPAFALQRALASGGDDLSDLFLALLGPQALIVEELAEAARQLPPPFEPGDVLPEGDWLGVTGYWGLVEGWAAAPPGIEVLVGALEAAGFDANVAVHGPSMVYAEIRPKRGGLVVEDVHAVFNRYGGVAVVWKDTILFAPNWWRELRGWWQGPGAWDPASTAFGVLGVVLVALLVAWGLSRLASSRKQRRARKQLAKAVKAL